MNAVFAIEQIDRSRWAESAARGFSGLGTPIEWSGHGDARRGGKEQNVAL